MSSVPINAPRDLAKIVTEFYLKSNDFNGWPVRNLVQNDQTLNIVKNLILASKLDLVRGDGHPNPHIKALPAEEPEIQVKKIDSIGLKGCLYPTPAYLIKNAVAIDEQRPFTKELKFGSAQLEFRVFDLRLLEWYRNDPRYKYKVDDIHGSIYRSDQSLEGSQIGNDVLDFIDFGFAYDDDFNRGIAIFLRYLHDKSLDEQQHLSKYLLPGNYKLHPDFWRTQIIGDFPEKVSIYDAFLEERHHINRICELEGRKRFFRTETKAYERPNDFGILLRPTNKEYSAFALLLDKLLSDDIDLAFFGSDVETSEILTKGDGSAKVSTLGSISVLDSWLKRKFRTEEPEVVIQLIKNMRDVRTERQKPAHKVEQNSFDQEILKWQRQLMSKAYSAVRTLRMVLENMPKARDYAKTHVPDWLRDGEIWEM